MRLWIIKNMCLYLQHICSFVVLFVLTEKFNLINRKALFLNCMFLYWSFIILIDNAKCMVKKSTRWLLFREVFPISEINNIYVMFPNINVFLRSERLINRQWWRGKILIGDVFYFGKTKNKCVSVSSSVRVTHSNVAK